MKCPVCKEPMIVLELDEVEIDYCTSCGGIWLDAGELDLLIEDEKDRELLLSSFHKDAEHPEKDKICSLPLWPPVYYKSYIKTDQADN